MDVTLLQLQVFAAVAATGHFGRAAAELRVSQPTVSAQLKRLEGRLGMRLVDRSHGASRLTPAGAELLPAVLDALESARGVEDLAAAVRRRRARVRAVVSPSLVNGLMPAMLEALEQRNGAPELEVVDVDTGRVVDEVLAGRADVGLGHFLPVTAGLGRARAGWEEARVLSGAGVLGAGAVRLESLTGRPLLIWPREQNPEYFDALLAICRERGLEPSIEQTAGRLTGAHSYRLRSGEAFSLVPADFAVDTSASFSSAPLDPPACLPLDIVWAQPLVPGAEVVVETLSDVLRSRSGGCERR